MDNYLLICVTPHTNLETVGCSTPSIVSKISSTTSLILSSVSIVFSS